MEFNLWMFCQIGFYCTVSVDAAVVQNQVNSLPWKALSKLIQKRFEASSIALLSAFPIEFLCRQVQAAKQA